MADADNLARRAIELARKGDSAAALEAALGALARSPKDLGLRIFTAMLLAREMRLEEALAQFTEASRLSPAELLPRLESARILIGLDHIDEAERKLAAIPDGTEKRRIMAQLDRRRGRFDLAAKHYRSAVQARADDHESWGHLGVCLLAMNQPVDAAEALATSLRLRRDQQMFREKWADAEVAAGRADEAIRRVAAFAAEHPNDALSQVTLARLHALADRPAEARLATDEALRRQPDHVPAWLLRAEQDEAENRIEDLQRSLARLAQLRVQDPRTALLQARLAYRQGDLEEALKTIEEIPAGADPGGRAHLLGLISDRMNDADGAFAAFEAMNREAAMETADTRRVAKRFRDTIAERSRLASRPWIRSWRRPKDPPARPAPVFMIGFPRSGTTLLDTLLMGHPQVAIAEEKPMLARVSEAAGGYARLADLETDEIETLRALYFAQAEIHVGRLAGKLLVDKLPLGTIEIPLIHRIFPDARFIFVQRHPCDVVLSGFMTRFQPVDGMTNFLDLEDTARLYDRVLNFWLHCRAVLPLVVHLVRYERLVEDVEAEMRPLASFLNLPWTDRMLDHRATAKARGHVATPSYAQITESINDRSIGRWERYRAQMEPVLPILKPWADVLGYDI